MSLPRRLKSPGEENGWGLLEADLPEAITNGTFCPLACYGPQRSPAACLPASSTPEYFSVFLERGRSLKH